MTEDRTTHGDTAAGPAAADWRVFRPAIWLAMLGVALLLVINVYLGLALVGAGIGVGLRIQARRRSRRVGARVTRTRRR